MARMQNASSQAANGIGEVSIRRVVGAGDAEKNHLMGFFQS
jgi:hypothetical protein